MNSHSSFQVETKNYFTAHKYVEVKCKVNDARCKDAGIVIQCSLYVTRCLTINMRNGMVCGHNKQLMAIHGFCFCRK